MYILFFLVAIAPILVRSWSLIDTYDAMSWSGNMRLETGTFNAEYVNYLTRDAAQQSGLIQNRNGQLYLGVDSWTVLNPNSGIGRNSVRIRSNKSYNSGTLVIGDFAHMPANVCGVWPAFWMVGASWPGDGEIDILEGVNQMTQNQITLHTNPGCTPYPGPGGQTGVITGNADCGAGGGGVGCGVLTTRSSAWGSGMNAAGGGVYAMLWVGSGIKVWHFEPGQVPGDIRSGNPWPESWGTPVANFAGCDFSRVMNNMHIVINTAFCGGWAGSVWKSGSCASAADQCYQYVAANPWAFSEAYWLINSIKVYQ